MTRFDPDEVADTLADSAGKVKRDARIDAHDAADFCHRLNALTRDIASAMLPCPRLRSAPLTEAAQQAMLQGSADRGLLA